MVVGDIIYCVVDMRNVSEGYEVVDKGSRGRGRDTRGVVEGD